MCMLWGKTHAISLFNQSVILKKYSSTNYSWTKQPHVYNFVPNLFNVSTHNSSISVRNRHFVSSGTVINYSESDCLHKSLIKI